MNEGFLFSAKSLSAALLELNLLSCRSPRMIHAAAPGSGSWIARYSLSLANASSKNRAFDRCGVNLVRLSSPGTRWSPRMWRHPASESQGQIVAAKSSLGKNAGQGSRVLDESTAQNDRTFHGFPFQQ
ncbi:uncharacterized protein LOC112342292 [Selaginella moellendorffii]|uniref:uncharacterized protein LOC112342282 n=1 Tax=Selaginella moellendorffii TaxID=88036 RepID=UPI000D1D0412|nr:uncharacterized protein LOC112342282 [Selaginella moellendorffii]XP_024519636.1 uncharacterized protein LOC112342292 [Selaginella moellendorffii]|eukprot:XP_024519616.1 uncharacterized protein LOC112342282 [Selaginella moellendorffii]